jgi:hypothetical protein
MYTPQRRHIPAKFQIVHSSTYLYASAKFFQIEIVCVAFSSDYRYNCDNTIGRSFLFANFFEPIDTIYE